MDDDWENCDAETVVAALSVRPLLSVRANPTPGPAPTEVAPKKATVTHPGRANLTCDGKAYSCRAFKGPHRGIRLKPIAVRILQRFFEQATDVLQHNLQLVGIAALLMASKYQDQDTIAQQFTLAIWGALQYRIRATALRIYLA